MSAFDGIVDIINWVKDKLPIQDRKERWKNELDNLEKERKDLLQKKATPKLSNRLLTIDRLIRERVQWLKNSSN